FHRGASIDGLKARYILSVDRCSYRRLLQAKTRMICTAQPHNLRSVTPRQGRAHFEGYGLAILDAKGVGVAQEWLTRRLQGQFPTVTCRIDAIILIQDEFLARMLFPALAEQGPVSFRQRPVLMRGENLQRVPFGPCGARQIPGTVPTRLHDHEASS